MSYMAAQVAIESHHRLKVLTPRQSSVHAKRVFKSKNFLHSVVPLCLSPIIHVDRQFSMFSNHAVTIFDIKILIMGWTHRSISGPLA